MRIESGSAVCACHSNAKLLSPVISKYLTVHTSSKDHHHRSITLLKKAQQAREEKHNACKRTCYDPGDSATLYACAATRGPCYATSNESSQNPAHHQRHRHITAQITWLHLLPTCRRAPSTNRATWPPSSPGPDTRTRVRGPSRELRPPIRSAAEPDI